MTSHKINIGKAVYSVKQHENGTFTTHNCSTLREVKSENTMRKIFKALAERDHAEALEIDAVLNEHNKEIDQLGFLLNAPAQRRKMVERDHAEALGMNEQYDFYSNPDWQRQLLAKAHREALEMDAETNRRRHLSVMASIQNTIMERDDLPALVEACHAVALEMNDECDIAKVNAARLQSQHGNASQERQERWLEEAHAEALEINTAIDSMIEARQQIANKEPDFLQEAWDLVRLGNSYKEAGREWYRWAKATALRLWESSLAQRQRPQAQ
ncbi:hypothetical protein [Enterobacter bugandensis]|uniref:hypothetical protein n=1 Tax=Enterobacter bugandensis TaxID=881260 RepID=UPI0007A521AD|nr:hypothetical protein [Enterobacter bugandensis]